MASSWIPFCDVQLNQIMEMEEEALANVEWSENSLPLWKFVKDYPLPQIVYVADGFYSQDEDSSLSAGQIIKIHCSKTVMKVFGCDQKGNEVHIALNTPQKIRMCPKNHDHVFETVGDLASAKPLPKFVQIIRGYYDPAGKSAESCQDLSVEAGEILEVFRTTDHPRFPRLSKEKLLTLKNMKGIEIELPLQCKPGFKAVLQRDSCFLAEAVNTQTFPFYARFEAANSQIQTSDRKKLSKFGVIKFEKVYDENIIIASCGHKNVRVVFTVPINIDVTVKVACGALTNDAEYTDLCQEYNNYERIDELAMKQLENELDLKSGEVRGYEYHIKTATEGHFVGFPPEEEENIRNSNKSRSEEMTEKVAKKSRHPYEKIYCMPGKTTKENDQLDEEKLNQDSYGNDLETSQQKMLGNEDSQVDTSLKKPPVKEEVKGYQNHQKRDDSTLESTDEDRPLSSNVDANGIKKEQQHISQNPVKQVYSADKQRVAMKLLTTAKPFTPTLAPKPKKQYQLLAPKELSSTVSSSETTVKKVEGNSSPVPEVPDFQIPDDLSTLDINGICACLKKLNLSKLIETFVENQINGSLLVSLDDEDYKDLGLKSFERKKIMKFAEGWRPDNP